MGLTGFRGLYPIVKKNTIGEDIKQLKVAGFYNVPLKLRNIIESEPVVWVTGLSLGQIYLVPPTQKWFCLQGTHLYATA